MLKMKYLHATALLALCILFMAGTALAQPSWSVLAETGFPTGMWWDQSAAPVSIDTENNGLSGTWQDTWALKSVQGLDPDEFAIDRWGLSEVPVPGPVARTQAPPRLSGLLDFDFNIVAPPIVSVEYATPITPTAAPVMAPLDCNWYLADGSDALLTTDVSEQAITVNRFLDILPGTSGEWCAPYVEECAGRVPAIVGGYGGGLYRPDGPMGLVNRGAMAVYMARALNLPLEDYAGTFPTDVPDTQWAWPWIEALAREGLVGGYGGGVYAPDLGVNRDAMAVYVARGMLDSTTIPPGPGTATFTDVPTTWWAYDAVEYCVANNIVGGYGGGLYVPDAPTYGGNVVNPISRGQMAVFVYRAFIRPVGTAVVLAGPAVTAAPGDYDGWTSAAVGEADDPGTAYIALDVARLDTDMAPFDVKFELRDAATPTVPATGDYTGTVTIDSDDITNGQAAADVSGNPYLYALWTIPADLDEGDYILVTSVDGVELARQPAFTIGPIPEPPALDQVVVYMTTGQSVNEGAYVSGTYSDIAADDDNYVVVNSGGTGKVSTEWHSSATSGLGLDAETILTAQIDVVAKCSSIDFPGSVISGGAGGATTWCADLVFDTADTDTTIIWVSANKAKFVDMLNQSSLRVILAQCCGADEYTTGDYTTSYDLVKCTFTIKP